MTTDERITGLEKNLAALADVVAQLYEGAFRSNAHPRAHVIAEDARTQRDAQRTVLFRKQAQGRKFR